MHNPGYEPSSFLWVRSTRVFNNRTSFAVVGSHLSQLQKSGLLEDLLCRRGRRPLHLRLPLLQIH